MTLSLTLLLPFGQTFCASCRKILQSVAACFFSETALLSMSGLTAGAGAAVDGGGGFGATVVASGGAWRGFARTAELVKDARREGGRVAGTRARALPG